MNSSESDLSSSLTCMDLEKASTHKSIRHESYTDPHYNKVNKMETSRFDTAAAASKSDSSLEVHLNHKRCKPRRLSGDETANVTEEIFRESRRFLVRDDSVALLKARTTNAISMVVPLVLAESEQKEAAEERPLSRINRRRRKPRRFSGDAVQDQTRPIMVRDDSVVLRKKKLAGLVPLTLELEELPPPPSVHQGGETLPTTRSTPARTQSMKVNRLTRKEKQQGYVRQNSCGARTA